MGILTRIKGAFGITFGSGPGAEQFPEQIAWKRDAFGDHGRAGVVNPYQTAATVQTAVARIANDAASIAWEMFPRGKSEEPIVNHPVLDALERPNMDMAGPQLNIGTIVSLLLSGEGFWYYPDLSLRKTGVAGALSRVMGQTGELTLLDPRGMVWEEGQWKWRANGVLKTLNQGKLTVFKRFNPYNSVRGLAPLSAAMMDLESDHFASAWNLNFFKHGATPSGLLKPAAATLMTPDQKADILRAFGSKHGGRGFLDFGASQHDMDYRALREYSRGQVLAVFGVPPFLAGVMDKANYANAREQESFYWRHTIKPLLDMIQAVINHDFLPKMGVTDALAFPKWEAVAALIEDQEKKSEIARRYWEMGVPFAQLNERFDLGFDPKRIDMADESFLPLNNVPVSALSLTDRTGQSDGGALQGQDNPGEESPAERGQKNLRQFQRGLLWKSLAGRTLDLERTFDTSVRGHLRGLHQEALRNLDGVKGWRFRAVRVKADERFFLFDIDKADAHIVQVTRPIYQRTMERGGDSLLMEIGLAGGFSATSPSAVRLMLQNAKNIKGMNLTIGNALRDSLRQGVAAGEAVDALRDRVDGVFQVGMGRSRVIARTEVGSSFNGARQIAMKSSGIERQEWLTARDGNVRDLHISVDGEIVAVGESFSNGLAYPLDPAGPVEEVASCRCVAVPVTGAA